MGACGAKGELGDSGKQNNRQMAFSYRGIKAATLTEIGQPVYHKAMQCDVQMSQYSADSNTRYCEEEDRRQPACTSPASKAFHQIIVCNLDCLLDPRLCQVGFLVRRRSSLACAW